MAHLFSYRIYAKRVPLDFFPARSSFFFFFSSLPLPIPAPFRLSLPPFHTRFSYFLFIFFLYLRVFVIYFIPMFNGNVIAAIATINKYNTYSVAIAWSFNSFYSVCARARVCVLFVGRIIPHLTNETTDRVRQIHSCSYLVFHCRHNVTRDTRNENDWKTIWESTEKKEERARAHTHRQRCVEDERKWIQIIQPLNETSTKRWHVERRWDKVK